jgi:hypothetical protein
MYAFGEIMLALLHIPSGQLVKLSFTGTGVKPPVVDLEFIYKNEFYRGDVKYSFSVWLEKLQAKIIADAMPSYDAFIKQNPMLKNADTVHAEFAIVEIDQATGYPNMSLENVKIHTKEEFKETVQK